MDLQQQQREHLALPHPLITFLQIAVPQYLFIFFILILHFYTNLESNQKVMEEREQVNIQLSKNTLFGAFDGLVSDLLFLGAEIGQSLSPELGQNRWRLQMGERIKNMVQHRQLYDQIRLFDLHGVEMIRVNYRNGDPEIVALENLQDKSHRYYFRKAQQLQPGEIYLSPLDLNVEGGRIEIPYKPMIRAATPVVGSEKEVIGYLVLNYFGRHLLDSFANAMKNIEDHAYLLSNEGYWLSHPDVSLTWGHMLEHRSNFRESFPYEWLQMQKYSQGQFYSNLGLFTFSKIFPNQYISAANRGESSASVASASSEFARSWTILAHIPQQQLDKTLGDFLVRQHILYGSVLIAITLATLLLNYYRRRNRMIELQNNYDRRFRLTLEQIDLAAVTLNQQGTITFCNDYFIKLSGWNKDELLGQNWFQRFIDEDGQSLRNHLLDADQQIHNFSQIVPIICRNGERRILSWHITYSRSPHNRQLHSITAIGEDITEQQKAQNELIKLFRAFEQSSTIVTITDTRGVIEYVNPKFTEVTGYRADEVVGQNSNMFRADNGHREEYHELWKALSEGREWSGEFLNLKRDGSSYWESALISPIRNTDGVITHYLAVKEDISDRKRLESEIREKRLELERSQIFTALGKMSGMIAHDLRNPLSSIKMTLQILNKHPAINNDADIKELGNISLEQVRYMEHIINDLLTYSRSDVLQPEWISVGKLLEMSVILLQREIQNLNITISTYVESGLPTIHGDETKLRQVFSNLIGNALQAVSLNPEGHRRISIEANLIMEEGGNQVVVSICDNGPGLEGLEKQQIFEPFFTTHAKGTGLGLPIVKRIVEQHLGRVKLENNHKGGACAQVKLSTEPLNEIRK